MRSLSFEGKRRRKAHSHGLIEHLQCDFEVLYSSLTQWSPHAELLRLTLVLLV